MASSLQVSSPEFYVYMCALSQGVTRSAHLNFLKPTGYVMHQLVLHSTIVRSATLYLCVLYLSENKHGFLPRVTYTIGFSNLHEKC